MITNKNSRKLKADHIFRMTDDTGMLHHSNYGVPDLSKGYTTIDNARALIMAVKLFNQTQSKKIEGLIYKYVSFLSNAQNADGTFRNIMGYNREFLEETGSEECFGYCLWASCYTFSDTNMPYGIKMALRDLIDKALPNCIKITASRAIGYVIIGLNYLGYEKTNGYISKLAATLADHYIHYNNGGWHWFEDSLTSCNAVLPRALLTAHNVTKESRYLNIGLESLQFLESMTFTEHYFKPIGYNGLHRQGNAASQHDEQPVEASESISAYVEAFLITNNAKYIEKAKTCFYWYIGRNSIRRTLLDYETGGCHDGIDSDRLNPNQGAESIISFWLAYLEIKNGGNQININEKKINVGIGFVTGRKNFKNVIKTYVNNWNESGLVDDENISLHLFVAYDLTYTGTTITDYKITDEEILDTVDSAYYLGNSAITNEAQFLIDQKAVTLEEAALIFGEGYAMKRNAVLYFALKNKMDYLIFFDDDEYPIANIRINNSIVWKGQEVLSTHIKNIMHADMTHGHHCGYISPIPQLDFYNNLTEDDFRIFIESISNDIVNWNSIKEKMNDGGVTYAEFDIINSNKIEVVNEKNGMKFISGANLGFNLKNIDKLFPFYNPPGARGEDTFLSTCICDCTIRKVPCYTFHDGFSTYEHLLLGVLPNKLLTMKADSGVNTKRFLRACIGWIRYKPLLLYITQREVYEAEIIKMKINLENVIPKICNYFEDDGFNKILDELEFFHAHVEDHFADFENTKSAWLKIIEFLSSAK